MADDDRALMERLAALEVEVKADADVQKSRKEAALSKVREERAKAEAEKAELRERQASLVRRKPVRDSEEYDSGDGLAGALELAGKANRVKGELARKPTKGQKSWIKSGLASTFLGPLGWLYAGSWREAVPASAAWLVVLAIANAMPALLLMPVLIALAVAMPLSGVAGAIYALQYNRSGKRQRLFGEDKKQLPEKT